MRNSGKFVWPTKWSLFIGTATYICQYEFLHIPEELIILLNFQFKITYSSTVITYAHMYQRAYFNSTWEILLPEEENYFCHWFGHKIGFFSFYQQSTTPRFAVYKNSLWHALTWLRNSKKKFHIQPRETTITRISSSWETTFKTHTAHHHLRSYEEKCTPQILTLNDGLKETTIVQSDKRPSHRIKY